jgi:3-hydroxyisobutyrate dehydrogenase
MGASMAAHLLRAGHRVVVFNRTHSRAQAWVAEHGGRCTSDLRLAIQGAAIIISCVGRDDDVRQLVQDASNTAGVSSVLAAGQIWIDHTTTSATLAKDMAALLQTQGVAFVDAPVSGGNVGAQQGTLSVMCGGAVQAVETATSVLQAYARSVVHMGESGTGQLAKMVNQISVAGVLQGLAEALAFGQQAGLDMDKVLQAVSQGAASSWQMVNRGPTMLQDQFDFGFAVDWMRKDLGLCLAQASAQGSHLPVTAQIDQFYAELQAMGGGRWDTSSLIKRLYLPKS